AHMRVSEIRFRERYAVLFELSIFLLAISISRQLELLLLVRDAPKDACILFVFSRLVVEPVHSRRLALPVGSRVFSSQLRPIFCFGEDYDLSSFSSSENLRLQVIYCCKRYIRFHMSTPGIKIVCLRCEYEWFYNGTFRWRVRCPQCNSSRNEENRKRFGSWTPTILNK